MKILIFYIFFYLSIGKAFALPLLGVVPFVFDISILLITFFIGIINYFIFFLIKKVKIMIFIITLLFLFTLGYIFYLIGLKGLYDINLFFYIINIKYVLFILLVSFILFAFYFFKKYLLIFFVLLILVGININILKEIIILNNTFIRSIEKLNLLTDNSVIFKSKLVLNNIIVSRDISFIYNNKNYNCRLSFSYYIYNYTMRPNYKNALKSSQINLYIGDDGQKVCRKLLESK